MTTAKLKAECLLSWIKQQGIVQKPQKHDKEDEKRIEAIKYEMNVITGKKRKHNQWHKQQK